MGNRDLSLLHIVCEIPAIQGVSESSKGPSNSDTSAGNGLSPPEGRLE